MEKKPNPALEKYEFLGKYKGGICGDTGIQYNVNTISERMIEGMISVGSKLWKKKEVKASADKAAKAEEKK